MRKLEKHGSILDDAAASNSVVENATMDTMAEEGEEKKTKTPEEIEAEEEAEELRKKEEQKNLFKASVSSAHEPRQSFTTSSKKSKKKEKEELSGSKYEVPEKKGADADATTPLTSPNKGTGGGLSPDTESAKREEQSLATPGSTPSPSKTLKPSVPPLSKTVVSPTGDRHKYTRDPRVLVFPEDRHGRGGGGWILRAPPRPL